MTTSKNEEDQKMTTSSLNRGKIITSKNDHNDYEEDKNDDVEK